VQVLLTVSGVRTRSPLQPPTTHPPTTVIIVVVNEVYSRVSPSRRPVRRILRIVGWEVGKRWSEMNLQAIANLIFLRFLSPAIVSPHRGDLSRPRASFSFFLRFFLSLSLFALRSSFC
jgi:hypothetical protein